MLLNIKKKSIKMVKKAVLFIDIVSSSSMWSANGQKMRVSLKKFDVMVKTILRKYPNAFIVKTIGDAYMICFDEWTQSYEFAKELQLDVQLKQPTLAITKDLMFRMRIGIAFGEVETETMIIQNRQLKDLFGNTVNTASRMESKVSPIGGVGITVLIEEEVDKFMNYMMEELKDDKYRFEIFSFNQDCLKLKKRMFEQSSRLLNNYHYTCKSLDDLKGVEHVDYCFKIYFD
jgi:hypothetical protein